MSEINGNKRYAIIVKAANTFSWLNFSFSYDDGASSEPIPSVDSGSEAVHVSDVTLGALTEAEFLAQKKPVFVGEYFDAWADKALAPVVTIDGNPFDDGSSVAEISITGGPADADYGYEFSRPNVSCNKKKSTGTLDGSGEGSFKIKVYGQDAFTVRIFPRGNNEFQDGILTVTVDAGPFA